MAVTSKQLMEDFLREANEKAINPEKYRGWHTGIADLDRLLGGLHRGWYFIVAGKRKAGKTAFLTTLTRELGYQGVRFLRVSLEEGNMQVAERQVSNQAGIDRSHFRDVRVEEEEWPRVIEATDIIGGFDGYWDQGVSTVRELHKLVLDLQPEVLIVDYVQLMSGSGESRTTEVANVSRGLKALTLLDPPLTVVAAAQLNDEGDYLWSRDLGRDADVGIKLERKVDAYGQVVENQLKLEVADSRHSELASFDILFNGARSLVGSLMTVNINEYANEKLDEKYRRETTV